MGPTAEHWSGSRSILAGWEYELTTFDIHQAWNKLLSEKGLVIRQKTAIIDISPTTSGVSYLSFEQLEMESTVLAQHLLTHFGRPAQGDWIIAVCLPPSIDLIISLVAIFKAGAAYVPLDPTFPKNRIAHICADAKPALFLTSTAVMNDAIFEGLEEIPTIVLVNAFMEKGQGSFSPIATYNLSCKPFRQDLAAVLYTSGSTGTPKGVRLTHFNLLSRLSWQWGTFPFTSEEVACFKTALTFADSIAEIWAPLLKGIPIVIIPKVFTQNPQLFVETLDKFRVTRLVLVPSLLSSILQNNDGIKGRLNSLRLWVCSGEILPVQLLHKFYENFNGAICNFYGSTEITADVTFAVFRCKEDVDSTLLEGRVPLGAPLDNCTIYILDPMGEPVERGKSGEIFISGAHVADGYIQGKVIITSSNNNSFVPNNIQKKKGHAMLYRTGDYGKIVSNQLYYDGRTDSQVKVRGHRVNLTEINSILNELDQVEKGVVLCWKPGQAEQEILAFVTSSQSSESIYRKLKERLVSYAMPRILVVKDIPLLVNNGKVDRQSLIHYYENHCRTDSMALQWNENELQLPEENNGALARALFKTVSLVLGGSLQKSLSLLDNFFFVGGNSLNAVIVVTKLKDQGIRLEVSEFLEAENFGQIVLLLANNKSCNNNIPEINSQRIGLPSKYRIDLLTSSMKSEVIRITSECFVAKGEWTPYNSVSCEDYEAVLDEIWEPILYQNLSFVVKNYQDNKIVACGINCDFLNPPVAHPKTKNIGYVFELSSALKAPFRESLVCGKSKGRVLQNFMVATDISLLPVENVAIVELIERETVLLAERNGFKAIISSNASPLTQQICDDILNYEILSEYQVNQFVASDGEQPFATAPDSLIVKCSVKYL